MRPIAIALVLVACGASQPGRTDGHVRTDLACTERVPSGESECVARGCGWRAPLFCSGVPVPDEERVAFEHDVARECVCVCERDLVDCMRVP